MDVCVDEKACLLSACGSLWNGLCVWEMSGESCLNTFKVATVSTVSTVSTMFRATWNAQGPDLG